VITAEVEISAASVFCTLKHLKKKKKKKVCWMIGISHVLLCMSYFQWWRRTGVHSFLTFWQGKKVAWKRVKALSKLWTLRFSFVLDHAVPPRGSVIGTYYATLVLVCDLSFVENLHSYCSMVPCLSTMQCLITILMFRICCRTGTRRSFHIQTLHLVISFCFLMSRSHCGVEIWICRHHQHCCLGVFMPSEKGW
jgi:hypothetical protein